MTDEDWYSLHRAIRIDEKAFRAFVKCLLQAKRVEDVVWPAVEPSAATLVLIGREVEKEREACAMIAENEAMFRIALMIRNRDKTVVPDCSAPPEKP